LAEQLTLNQRVVGSSPTGGTYQLRIYGDGHMPESFWQR
jgi:hypothetical protein